MKSIDLTGYKYGRWTVISKSDSKRWNCICECGSEKQVSRSNLRSGKSVSCGCFARQKLSERMQGNTLGLIDLSGTKIGRISILRRITKNESEFRTLKGRNSQYLCRCDCGKKYVCSAHVLTSGRAISCGCYNREVLKSHTQSNHPGWKGYKKLSGNYITEIKKGAVSRGLKYDVSKEYLYGLFVFQNERCALSGIQLSLEFCRGKRQTASLDRIDSSKGYVEGNVQWVHKDVNKMKQDLPQNTFLNWCKLIEENMKTIKRVVNGVLVEICENGDVFVDNSVLPDYGGTEENLNKVCREIGEKNYSNQRFV